VKKNNFTLGQEVEKGEQQGNQSNPGKLQSGELQLTKKLPLLNRGGREYTKQRVGDGLPNLSFWRKGYSPTVPPRKVTPVRGVERKNLVS